MLGCGHRLGKPINLAMERAFPLPAPTCCCTGVQCIRYDCHLNGIRSVALDSVRCHYIGRP
jgi:hypothetical protein